MENIFNFATKELSQDAFLSWFIANCNEQSIGKYSYSFINFLTGYGFKYGEIKQVTIKQQEHNMDIIVDFWTLNDLHYVIVIEDKTTSSAHSGQLKKYANIMNGWNNDELDYINRRRKVFYKVDYLTEQDNIELEKGNEGFDIQDHWRTFDIEDIYEFFSRIPVTQSEILNSYIEHINQIYEDLNIVPKNPITGWNYANYQTFFKKAIDEKFSKKGWDYHFETWLYQGRLVSVAFYYHPKNKKLNKSVSKKYPCFAYPLVEFVFRKYAKEIMVYTHITYHWFDDQKYKNEPDRWTWKYTNYEPNVQEAQTFMETLKKVIDEKLGVKTRKMKSIHDQTISTDYIEITDSIDILEGVILQKLTLYFEAFEIADKVY